VNGNSNRSNTSAGTAVEPARVEGLRTVVDVFERAVQIEPSKQILRSKIGDTWQPTTFAAWRDTSGIWARGLCALGLELGDRVGLIAVTRREWLFADMGILMAGGVTVPVYPSAMAEEAQFVLENSECRFAFVEDPAQLEKLVAHRAKLPKLEKIIYIQDVAVLERPDPQGRLRVRLDEVLPLDDPWLLSLEQLAGLGRRIGEGLLYDRREQIQPSQPATIVYTSGTTGRPKGVVLTHDAFVFETQACETSMDVHSDDGLLLFLPLAHVFAKMVYVVCVNVRCEMLIPRSIATVLQDMAEAQPTVMPAVPRIFEKAHAKIMAGVEAGGPVKKKIFQWALGVGREVSKLRQEGKEPVGVLRVRYELANRIVFTKIHAAFGGRVRGFISGAAPLSRELSEFFHAVGLLILEGYGMTENCAAATVNRLDHYKFGTVGLPIPGVQIRIADDGEVLIKGRNVMREYWNNPEATAQTLQDGWLHTGDVGELDAEGFLRITDRKKDIIVTAGGKNVAPQNIEAHIKNAPFLSQVMVYGDNRKFLTALITLEEDAICKWADQRGIRYATTAELTQNADVYKLVDGIIQEKNRTLASYETLKKFAILERDLTVEDGDLTPSLKMRRKEVTRKYQDLLDSFYSEHY
jgi:long-chain acyl-CoA synthetase